MKYLTPAVRRRLYEVGVAVLGLLIVLDVIDGDVASSIDQVLAAALLTLARANVVE